MDLRGRARLVLLLLAAFCLVQSAFCDGIPLKALIVSADPKAAPGVTPAFVDQVAAALENRGVSVERATDCLNAWLRMSARRDVGAVVIDTDLGSPADLIKLMRSAGYPAPVFLLAGRSARIGELPPELYSKVDAVIRKGEDTPAFIAGTVRREMLEYQASILPPFFKALVKHVDDAHYAWSTPGHTGGLGFLASAPGTAFFDFFGENVFRADLSSSMSDLGSILEHEGPAGEAEKEAAKVFKADHTFFVLNGTSTSNKMVWQGVVTSGDAVLADRNCHKSIMHSIIMTRSVPAYFPPTRNSYGIIGPIHLSSFSPEVIASSLKGIEGRLRDKDAKPRIAVVTNSTYDGLCYDVAAIKDRLSGQVSNLHFDEAWYGYAAAHPLYAGRFAMSSAGERADHPPTYATQSTHKLLAAFSQSSMIHIKDGGKVKVDPERFNEAFLMHESTSPFYPMFASIDVSAKMMAGQSGRSIMDRAIEEAVEFRQAMVRIPDTLPKGDWWFKPWQPDAIDGVPFGKVDPAKLCSDASCWTLKDGDKWHGFPSVGPENVLLDPIKVTLLTPGLNVDGSMGDDGIPAQFVFSYLIANGVVPEKVGFYNFLFLFAPGVTKGKAETLISELFKFKELHDGGASMAQALPALVAKHPGRYAGRTLKEVCSEMHLFLKRNKIPAMMVDVYSTRPEMAMLPTDAYEKLVRGEVERVPISKLMGRTAASMIVPYPPGIPVLMPGERVTPQVKPIVDYLEMCERFDNEFPGFETEIHGVMAETVDGRKTYMVDCVKE